MTGFGSPSNNESKQSKSTIAKEIGSLTSLNIHYITEQGVTTNTLSRQEGYQDIQRYQKEVGKTKSRGNLKT